MAIMCVLSMLNAVVATMICYVWYAKVWLLCVFLCAHSYLDVVCVVWASVVIMCILC
jgi:hypothetical protein